MKIMTADFPPNRGKAKEPSGRVVIAAVDEWVNKATELRVYTRPGHLCGPNANRRTSRIAITVALRFICHAQSAALF
jgi:hypothetical protein